MTSGLPCQTCQRREGHRLPGGFIVCEKCFPKAVEAFNEWMEEEE